MDIETLFIQIQNLSVDDQKDAEIISDFKFFEKNLLTGLRHIQVDYYTNSVACL